MLARRAPAALPACSRQHPVPATTPRDEHVAARTTTHRSRSQAARPRRHLRGRPRPADLRASPPTGSRSWRSRASPSRSTPRSTACGSSCSSSRRASSSPSSRRWAAPSPTGASRSVGGGPVVRKAARAGAVLAGSLMAFSVIGAVAFGLTERLFHGQEVLLVCFVIALGTYAVQHITRGTFSGNGRFGPYGHDPGRRGRLPHPAGDRGVRASASTTCSGTGSRSRSRR